MSGTFQLLQAVRAHWEGLSAERQAAFRVQHISTDEVCSSLGATSRFSETTPYDPRSPYSAQGDGAAEHHREGRGKHHPRRRDPVRPVALDTETTSLNPLLMGMGVAWGAVLHPDWSAAAPSNCGRSRFAQRAVYGKLYRCTNSFRAPRKIQLCTLTSA